MDIISRITSVSLYLTPISWQMILPRRKMYYFVLWFCGTCCVNRAHTRMLWRKSSIFGLYAVHFDWISECLATTLSAGAGKDTKKHVSPPRSGYLEARFPLLLWLPTASDLTNDSCRLRFCLGAKEYVLIALHMKGFDVNDWEMYQHSRLDVFKVMGGPTSFPHLLSATN